MRIRTGAAILATSIALSGCAPEQPVGSSPEKSPEEPRIEFPQAVFPESLPEDVQRQERRSASIQDIKVKTLSGGRWGSAKEYTLLTGGSSVELGRGLFATARHVIAGMPCNYIHVHDPTSALKPVSLARSTINFPDSGYDDLGLIVTKSPEEAKYDESLLPKPKDVPRVGEDVYLVNYQPINERLRDPFSRNPSLRSPAIYGGLVLGMSRYGGDYVVATGYKSYGAVRDATTRGGASGGPVYNSEGKLIGLSVAGGIGLSVDQIDHRFGLNLADSPGAKGKHQITVVERISRTAIETLLNQAAGC